MKQSFAISKVSPNTTTDPLIVAYLSSIFRIHSRILHIILGKFQKCWKVQTLPSRPLVAFRVAAGPIQTYLTDWTKILTNKLDRTQTGPVSES